MEPRMSNKIWFLSQVYLNFIAYEIPDTIAGHKSDWSQVHWSASPVQSNPNPNPKPKPIQSEPIQST